MNVTVKKILLSVQFFLVSMFPAFGQSFSDDPEDAIARSVTLAQESVSNPLVFEGLNSVIVRYNRARSTVSPAGYENEEWFGGLFLGVSTSIREKSVFLEGLEPLPDEEIAEMLLAFDENNDAYYDFFEDIQGEYNLQRVSADQMLIYLAAYAVVANNIDPELWGSLSSFTGVWPLCFWQG